jgi:hypothetical protein
MSVADGGSAGWCTNWEGFDVPALWTFIAPEDSDANWVQVGAWRRACELIDYFKSELETRRTDLAEKWPPEHSAAAAVFVAYVDDLLDSMNETASRAYSTANALAGITVALATGRQRLEALYSQWQEREQLADSPRLIVDSTVPLDSVDSDWRDLLNKKAAALMRSTEEEIRQYSTGLAIPDVIRTEPDDKTTEPVPPIGSSHSVASNGLPGHMDPDSAIPRPQAVPGLLLADGTATIRSTRAPLPPTPDQADQLARPIPATDRTIGMIPPAPVSRTGAGRGGVDPQRDILNSQESFPFGSPTGRPPIPAAESTQSPQPTRSTSMLPIGPSGSQRADERRDAALRARRVNPVSGVIGARAETHTLPSGHTVTVSADRSGRHAAAARLLIDPKDPWTTARGVTPIIEPLPEREHNPGPGVIGLHRR